MSRAYAQKRDLLFEKYKDWTFTKRRAYPAQLGGATYDPAVAYALGAYVSFKPLPGLVANMPRGIGATTFVYVSLQAGNTGNEPDASPTFWRQISRPEWACIFQLPADFIEVIKIYPDIRNPREDQEVPFALEYEPPPGPGRLLFTDGSYPGVLQQPTQRQIGLSYKARVTDPSQFPTGFTEALAWELAVDVSTSIVKNPENAIRCKKAAEIEFNSAVANDKRNRRPDQPPIPSSIAARFGGQGYRRRGSY